MEATSVVFYPNYTLYASVTHLQFIMPVDAATQIDQQTANVSQELRESLKQLSRKQENTLVTLENRTSAFEEALGMSYLLCSYITYIAGKHVLITHRKTYNTR